MKRIVSIISFCFALSCISCAIDVDRYVGASIHLSNGSSHIVMVEYYDRSYHKEVHNITLHPEETIYIESSTYESSVFDYSNIRNAGMYAIPHNMTIIFDDEYAITYKWNDARYDNKLCNIDNYTYSRTRYNFGNFTYTFTDEDYEYAREHGEVVE